MALKYWFILIFAKPGNGKSLEQARMSLLTLREYLKTEKKYPKLPKRMLLTNQKLSLDGIKMWKPFRKMPNLVEWLNTHVRYWESPEQFRYCPREQCWRGTEVHRIHDCDIFIDEGATLFPADKWADTPIWLRKMWAQHRHNGLRFVMLTQDYKGIDINCRRMVWQTYYMKKTMGSRDISPTLPPLKRFSIFNPFHSIWGIYYRRRIDPMVVENDSMAMFGLQIAEKMNPNSGRHKAMKELHLLGVPEMHLITWRKINLYDTTQDVKEYEVKREIEHIEVRCNHPNCGYLHKTHKLK